MILQSNKPLEGLEMGVWREADLRKDNYWFFAGLKHR
jgi:hypothetical protein